jgi:hypothetical protein
MTRDKLDDLQCPVFESAQNKNILILEGNIE